MLESIGDRSLTVMLSTATSNAKFQAGEVTEGLRLTQRAIDLADGDPTKDNAIVGSPLALALGLRGLNRLALGTAGWRDGPRPRNENGQSFDTTSYVAGILYKYCIPIHNRALLPDTTAMAETADAREIAERCGDDFALDSARLSPGMVLVTRAGPYRPAGFEAAGPVS